MPSGCVYLNFDQPRCHGIIFFGQSDLDSVQWHYEGKIQPCRFFYLSFSARTNFQVPILGLWLLSCRSRTATSTQALLPRHLGSCSFSTSHPAVMHAKFCTHAAMEPSMLHTNSSTLIFRKSVHHDQQYCCTGGWHLRGEPGLLSSF